MQGHNWGSITRHKRLVVFGILWQAQTARLVATLGQAQSIIADVSARAGPYFIKLIMYSIPDVPSSRCRKFEFVATSLSTADGIACHYLRRCERESLPPENNHNSSEYHDIHNQFCKPCETESMT